MTGRRGLLPGILSALAVLASVAVTSRPAEAQKKISVLTWNIPVYKEKIDGWIADFKRIHPDVQVEWLDKKGTEWATFYQTQLVGGTAPDIIDVEGGLWLEYAANGGLVDLTSYLDREPQLREYYNPKFLATWGSGSTTTRRCSFTTTCSGRACGTRWSSCPARRSPSGRRSPSPSW
jgi:ABC-type glycerol-3-phosphate transport system substrate-binding protein